MNGNEMLQNDLQKGIIFLQSWANMCTTYINIGILTRILHLNHVWDDLISLSGQYPVFQALFGVFVLFFENNPLWLTKEYKEEGIPLEMFDI